MNKSVFLSDVQCFGNVGYFNKLSFNFTNIKLLKIKAVLP